MAGIQRERSSPIHARYLAVGTALEDCAGLSVKAFALIILDGNGEEKLYTSRSLVPYQETIFTNQFRVGFLSAVRRATTRAYSQDSLCREFNNEHQEKRPSSGDSPFSQYQFPLQSRLDDSDRDESTTSRKGQRSCPSLYQGRHAISVNKTELGQATQQSALIEETEAERFYFAYFESMRQSCCKLMGQVFVKIVEPKKQSYYPYTHGDSNAPPWWPTKGENSVRHKEPSHLPKLERIRLLVHILQMIAQPRQKQCATVQELNLNIAKLQQSTMELMSNWFSDKEYPTNDAKRVLLEGIFRVATADERYKNGEITKAALLYTIRREDLYNLVDWATCTPEIHCDRTTFDGSNDDDEPDEGIKDGDGHEFIPFSATIPTPESLVLPTSMMQSQFFRQPDSSDLCIVRTIPVHHCSQPQLEVHDSYGNGSCLSSALPSNAFQPQSPHQLDLKHTAYPSSIHHGPPEITYDWQNSMASNDLMLVNFDKSAPPQSLAPSTYQLPPPISQWGVNGVCRSSPMNQDHVEMPHERYDAGPAFRNQLRTSSLHPLNRISQGFHDYLHDRGAYGQHDSDPKDDHNVFSG